MEITTLIVILGLLAASVFPISDRMRENYRNNNFSNDVAEVAEAFSIYAMENDEYPDSPGPGSEPERIGDYLPNFDWGSPTPFGGQWEWINNRHGIRVGIAVLDPEVSEDHLRRFDTAHDDGNLESGRFRFISEIRYAYVLEEGRSADDPEAPDETGSPDDSEVPEADGSAIDSDQAAEG